MCELLEGRIHVHGVWRCAEVSDLGADNGKVNSMTNPAVGRRFGGAGYRRQRPRRYGHGVVRWVAVTGGIGSGKSTVAQALRPAALAFADADAIAREIVAPGTPALAEIVQRFGDEVVTVEGTLDRASLASLIFTDPAARADLETITHPRIAQRAHEILSTPSGVGFVVYDLPLLRTEHEAQLFDEVVVVTAPLESRLERLERRGMSRPDALARIDAQMSDEERVALATIVVSNDGTVKDLHALGAELAQSFTTCVDTR